MKRKGYTGRSQEHSMNARSIKTSESEPPREYSKRYKYKILQDIRESMEQLKKTLEKEGYNITIIKDGSHGVIFNMDEHVIKVYPDVNISDIGFVEAEVILNVPDAPNLREMVIEIARREAHKRGLFPYVRTIYDNSVELMIESKKVHGSTDSIDAFRNIINTIKAIDKIGE